MHNSSGQPQTRSSLFTILIALILFYGIGHLTPASLSNSSSPLFGLSGPSVAYAEEEDEDEEDEEDEDEEDEEEGEEGEGEEGEGEEEDLSYLTDIGPAAEHEFGE
ncbi:MAG TPA: hypothetical protein QF772_03085, partial [Nitrospinaceae bacterium]|nr:hypothetical protein [Nitrospinaceae bacterium]